MESQVRQIVRTTVHPESKRDKAHLLIITGNYPRNYTSVTKCGASIYRPLRESLSTDVYCKSCFPELERISYPTRNRK